MKTNNKRDPILSENAVISGNTINQKKMGGKY
jgi:hypothetical protein